MSLMSSPIGNLTVEDYRDMPETGPRYQLVRVILHMSPAPNRFHQVISKNLQFVIQSYLESHPIGDLYNAPFDVCLTQHDVFQPDICFVRRENYELLSDAGLEGAPEFVAEILSPRTASLDKRHKREVYAAQGVKELWIIDPELRRIHIYDLPANPAKPRETFDEGETFQSAIFPGLAFSVDRIFRDIRPPRPRQ
jgi:Uma2 family endonuclease